MGLISNVVYNGAVANAANAAATAAEQNAASSSAAAEANLATRQGLRDEFLKTTGADGINTEAEKVVSQLLNDMLSRIDFSRPGGAAYAEEIKGFIASRAGNMGDGDIAHLYGVLKEAATALPAGTAGGEVNSAARERINGVFSAVCSDGGGIAGKGKGEHKETEVSQMLFDLLSQIDFSKPGGADYEKRIRDHIASMGKDFSDGEIAHLGNLLNEAALALTPSAPMDALPPPPAPLKVDKAPAETTTSSGDAKSSDTKSSGGAGETTGTGETSGAKTPAENDAQLLGVVRMLTDVVNDLVTAESDGSVSAEESGALLADLTKVTDVMQKLAEPATAPGGEATADTSTTQTAAGSGVHDAAWFFDKLGLKSFLEGLFGAGGTFGNGNTGLVDSIMANLSSNAKATA